MQNEKIQIAIAEDKKEDIAIIKKAFQNLPNYKLSIIATGGKDLIKQLNNAKKLPDLILMDMQMPCCDGLLATIICKNKYESIKIVGLSTHTYATVINEFMAEGGNGFLSKFIIMNDSAISISTYKDEHIFEKALIKIIKNNEIYFDPLCHYNQADYTKLNNTQAIITKNFEHLSKTNIMYLQLNAAGFTKDEIAENMHLTTITIKRYNAKLFKLFGAKSHKDLANLALMFGIAKTVTLYQKECH